MWEKEEEENGAMRDTREEEECERVEQGEERCGCEVPEGLTTGTPILSQEFSSEIYL